MRRVEVAPDAGLQLAVGGQTKLFIDDGELPVSRRGGLTAAELAHDEVGNDGVRTGRMMPLHDHGAQRQGHAADQLQVGGCCVVDQHRALVFPVVMVRWTARSSLCQRRKLVGVDPTFAALDRDRLGAWSRRSPHGRRCLAHNAFGQAPAVIPKISARRLAACADRGSADEQRSVPVTHDYRMLQ